MKLNMVGMGMNTYGDFEGLEVLGNFRIRALFHAKYGTPIFLEATSAPVMNYYYMKGGHKRMYKKPRVVSRWGMKIYAMRYEGSDPCNEYRLYDDIIEGARYTEQDLAEWVNVHFGTNFDGIYIADIFDDFTCDMFSDDWVADKELHDKREAAYKKYYEEVKEAERGVKRRFYPYEHSPILGIIGKDKNTITIRNYASKEYVEDIHLERDVILEVK